MDEDRVDPEERAPLQLSEEGAGVLLILAGIGLCAYVALRIVQALEHGREAAGAALYLLLFGIFGGLTIGIGWRRLARALRQRRAQHDQRR